MSYLHCNPTALRDVLALRILCRTGPAKVLQMYMDSRNNREDGYLNAPSGIRGFDASNVYRSTTYLPVYHLISHAKENSALQLISNGFKALIFAHMLQEESTFFKEMDLEGQNVDPNIMREYVAFLILHHLENIPPNVITISKLDSTLNCACEDGTGKLIHGYAGDYNTVPYAMGMFSLLSLMNHSCDPNAIPLRHPYDLTVGLLAGKKIKAGQEITASYRPLFPLQNTQERRAFLQEKYNFWCTCIACVSDWNPETVANYKNNNNNNELNVDGKLLENEDLKMEDFQRDLNEATSLMESGDFLQSLELVYKVINCITPIYSSIHPLCIQSQDLLKSVLVGIVNSHEQ